MARRVIAMIEIREVLYQYHQGQSIKALKRSLGLARNTIRSLILEAKAVGFRRGLTQDELDAVLDKLFLERSEVQASGPIQEAISSYHKVIEDWLKHPDMTGKQIRRLLAEQHNFSVSQRSLYRYLGQNCSEYSEKKEKKVTVRLSSTPGHQAQVDFGDVGKLYDPLKQQERRAYAFVMTLSHSRYRFVRFVFDQTIETWVDCHRRAFEFFGGIPKTIIIDNLKAGVGKPDVYDPTINLSYADCERHYGFIVDPAKVRTLEHKGRVERSISLPRQQILAGRAFATIEEANAYALRWCRHDIGIEVTSTTGHKPYELFVKEEKPQLLPLPETPFCCPVWQKAKVHRDCHVVFQGSFYSVPHAYVGQTVDLRADAAMVQIYDSSTQKVIKRHIRTKEKGQSVTDIKDYPLAMAEFIQSNAETYTTKAQEIGPYTQSFVKEIVTADSWQQRRKAAAVLRLAETFSTQELESGCRLMQQIHQKDYKTLKTLLTDRQNSYRAVKESAPQSSLRSFIHARFLRDPSEFKAFSKTFWVLSTTIKELFPL
jgi:transposase